MIKNTEAIVLRQIKAANGRRMIVLFSKTLGKISVGTNLTEGGKNKTALSIRPFTYGRYELFSVRDNHNLNSGQVIKSFFSLGEDLDKFMAASYALELTDRLLPEDLPSPALFDVLLSFMEELELREKKHDTLVLAYMVKALDIMGAMPELDSCVMCGEPGPKRYYSVKQGGMICPKCCEELMNTDNEPLIYDTDFGIVDILKYFRDKPVSSFRKLALDDSVQKKLKNILREHFAYHLEIAKLKSEEMEF